MPSNTIVDYSDIFRIENNVIKSIIEVNDVYDRTLGEEFIKSLKRVPDKEVMVCAATDRTWTGQQLLDDILNLANKFVHNGITKGTVIAFYTDDKQLGLSGIGILACGVAGACYTAGDFKYPFKEVHKMCLDSNARYLVASLTTLDVALQVKAALSDQIKQVFVIDPQFVTDDRAMQLFDLPNGDGIELPVRCNPETDLALLSFSSGTTGPPKVVTRSHRSTVAYRLMGSPPFNFSSRPGDVILVPCPLYHLSDVSLLFVGIFCNAKVILQSHAVKSLDFADKYKATTSFVVPSEINYYAKNTPPFTLDTVNDLLVAGSRPSTDVAKKFLSYYNIRLLRNGYGSTEMGWVSMLPSDRLANDFSCSGVVLPGVQVKVIDRENDEPLGPNILGELCVKSPQLFTQYLHNPKASAEAFDSDGFFYSGDCGYYDELGQIYVTDRYKEVLKCNGIQVSPTELEMVLTSHEDVQEAAVFGLPHDILGEIPKALVIRKPTGTVTTEELIRFVNSQLAHFKHIQGGLVFMDAFPRTTIGKIDRKALKAQIQML